MYTRYHEYATHCPRKPVRVRPLPRAGCIVSCASVEGDLLPSKRIGFHTGLPAAPLVAYQGGIASCITLRSGHFPIPIQAQKLGEESSLVRSTWTRSLLTIGTLRQRRRVKPMYSASQHTDSNKAKWRSESKQLINCNIFWPESQTKCYI